MDTALRSLLPRGYTIFEHGRVVIIEPPGGAPAWLSQKIPQFRLPVAEPVRMAVYATLYLNYEMARDPARKTGFAGDVLGPDPANTIGPLNERDKTMRQLLSLIAERSHGGMWIATPHPLGMRSAPWDFLEYQRQEQQDESTLRWIADRLR